MGACFPGSTLAILIKSLAITCTEGKIATGASVKIAKGAL